MTSVTTDEMVYFIFTLKQYGINVTDHGPGLSFAVAHESEISRSV
jgi:hypothetical protein